MTVIGMYVRCIATSNQSNCTFKSQLNTSHGNWKKEMAQRLS